MNLLADESVDRQIVERLQQDGFDVLYIAETEPSLSDEAVFALANEKESLLLTADKDFGELIFRDNKLSSKGIVLPRLAGLSSEKKLQIISDAFKSHMSEFPKAFSVIEPGKVRIRSTIY